MNKLKKILAVVKKESPIVYFIGLFHFGLVFICLIGLFVDTRLVSGINTWIKPLKFAISGGLYVLTSGYLATLYPFSKTKRNIINNLVSWSLALEIIIVFMQAARGVQSHYNQRSVLDGVLFGIMGILIGVVVMTMVLYIVETIRLKMKVARPIQWGILLGWIVVLFGSWVGGQMIGQMAHNVGVADGRQGLPLLNWSTIAGDLRVAHFFGLHGIQIIPLFAVVVVKKLKASQTIRSLIVITFGLLYTAWIAYTFYQAKQGIPLISPQGYSYGVFE